MPSFTGDARKCLTTPSSRRLRSAARWRQATNAKKIYKKVLDRDWESPRPLILSAQSWKRPRCPPGRLPPSRRAGSARHPPCLASEANRHRVSRCRRADALRIEVPAKAGPLPSVSVSLRPSSIRPNTPKEARSIPFRYFQNPARLGVCPGAVSQYKTRKQPFSSHSSHKSNLRIPETCATVPSPRNGAPSGRLAPLPELRAQSPCPRRTCAIAFPPPARNLPAMSETLTPMMQQYQGIRRTSAAGYAAALPARAIFTRCSSRTRRRRPRILNVALTKRNQVPMCGVPASRRGELHPAADQGRQARGDLRPGRRAAAGQDRRSARSRTSSRRGRSPTCRCSTRSGTIFSPPSARAKRAASASPSSISPPAISASRSWRTTSELADELARVQPAEVLVSGGAGGRSSASLRGLVARDGYTFLPDQA